MSKRPTPGAIPPAIPPAPRYSRDARGAILAALADALAGALGSVVAVVVFYPIDIAKTRAQASSSTLSSSSKSAGLRSAPTKHDTCEGGHGDGVSGSSTGPSDSSLSGGFEQGRERRWGAWFRSRTLTALLSIMKADGGLMGLYEGIEAKALQALVGSFVYFYSYAFIKGIMRRRLAISGGGQTGGASTPNSLRPSLNLLAAAMAGAVNQAFTLPLENITTRMQTAPQHRPSTSPSPSSSSVGRASADHSCVRGSFRRDALSSDGSCPSGGGVGGGANGDGVEVAGSLEGSARIDPCGGNTVGPIDGTQQEHALATSVGIVRVSETESSSENREHAKVLERRRRRRWPRQSVMAVTGELYHEGGGIGRFWRGFTPSLILTCNPAINYTAFDVLKAFWLKRRRASASGGGGGLGATGAGTGTTNRGTGGFLDPVEAFVIAAAAKSLATLITYPLIRAKVLLMTSPLSSLRSSSPTIGDADCSEPAVPPKTADEIDRGHRCGEEKESATLRCGDDTHGGSRNRSVRVTDAGLVSRGSDCRDLANGALLPNDAVVTTASPARMRERTEQIDAGMMPTSGAPGPAAAKVVGEKDEEREGISTSGIGMVLLDLFRREGLGGLYTGCGAQLLHTILKSALLLATKEQIARAAASAVLIGSAGKNGNAVSVKPRASR